LLAVLEGEDRRTLARQRRLRTRQVLAGLEAHVKCGNAVIGPDFHDVRWGPQDEGSRTINAFDWPAAFPEVLQCREPGFDAVIGNPPWGQKQIEQHGRVKEYLQERYPSAEGICDLFRPFVEQALRLTRRGCYFGLVLPDIVLLKDYAPTRKLLLDQLAIDSIDWWGAAFDRAVIDTTTLIGRRMTAGERHQVSIAVHDPKAPLRHAIPQQTFLDTPRCTFNLYLTPKRLDTLRRLEDCPKLGQFVEIHEGVHSGNLRAELFVDDCLDDTCRELIFGRDELAPYAIGWRGKFIRLGALPRHRGSAVPPADGRNELPGNTASGNRRYANAGRPEWYDREKILIRRTGDSVRAAVDASRRYASNNFFVVFLKESARVSLECLCGLLNSRLMTWYFQAIEPRKGRVFSELKIKHIRTFPIPASLRETGSDAPLLALARRRAAFAGRLREALPARQPALRRQCQELDCQIDARALNLFHLTESDLDDGREPESVYGES
jgi:hypothetical protein